MNHRSRTPYKAHTHSNGWILHWETPNFGLDDSWEPHFSFLWISFLACLFQWWFPQTPTLGPLSPSSGWLDSELFTACVLYVINVISCRQDDDEFSRAKLGKGSERGKTGSLDALFVEGTLLAPQSRFGFFCRSGVVQMKSSSFGFRVCCLVLVFMDL